MAVIGKPERLKRVNKGPAITVKTLVVDDRFSAGSGHHLRPRRQPFQLTDDVD